MKKTTVLLILILACLGLGTANRNVLALEPGTHAEINKRIVDSSHNNFYLDSFLIDNLNINDGKGASFYRRGILGVKTTNSVIDWISLGGEYEDTRPAPILSERSFFHFHDPTKPLLELNDAGFKGTFLGISKQWDSSIVWGLSKNKQASTPGLGDYSWPTARNYFYDALTATDEDTRNNNFSDCFRSIGQLMHLVEDLSVPEHTRNQGHITYNFEKWVSKNQSGPVFNNSMANPVIPYSPVLASQGYSDSNLGLDGLPISRLFDTYKYNGSNPVVTTGQDIGLSEFTNANFFSKKTVTKYNYPKDATFKNTSGFVNGKKRYYYGKDGDGVRVDHLAEKSYLDYILTEHGKQQDYNGYPLLDENCYKDYATLLLPRAKGYAFSLMQYFFRGDIDAVDAKTTSDSNGINGVKMKVKNKTPGANGQTEDIGAGNLVVSYQYKSGNSTIYGKSDPPLAFDNYSGHTYEFTGFTSPIPPDAKDPQYMLVYRGKLGAEDDAVAGKAFEANALIIDDWEREEVLWSSEDPILNLALSDTSVEGKKSMLIQVANGMPLEKKIYDHPPTVSNLIYYQGWDYEYDTIQVKEMGQKLLNGGGETITKLTLYLCDWFKYTDYATNYAVNLKPMIYIDNGVLPGEVLSEGDLLTINGVDLPGLYEPLKPITFTFPNGGVKLPTGQNYNISVKAISYSSIPVGGRALPCMPEMPGVNASFFWEYTQYYQEPEYGFTGTIYAIGSMPLATRNIPADCSKYNSFKITIKSDLAGNVVDFVYGTDKDHTAKSPLTVGPSWQTVEIPISQDVDKSKLAYFAFEIGKDGADETGKLKENVIYVDQIEAE